MNIDVLGAAQEVGRSCFIVNSDKKIMLDCGLKIHDKSDPHLYPLPPPEGVDAVVISHSHLDHIGFLPSLFDRHSPKVIATPPTKEIGELLLLDSAKIILEEYGTLPYKRSSHKAAMDSFKLRTYNQPMDIGETKITLFDAGHIPGSATVLLEYNGKRVLYSGDFKLSETQMHKPAEIVSDVDLLVIESTYANRDHPPRSDLEIELVREARETVQNGGNLLLPAFAVGRTQELLGIIKTHAPELPLWIDGMGVEASRIIAGYSSYVKDVKKFRKQLNECNLVQGPRDRKKALSEPSVIISTAGMLQGGPALEYLLSLNENSEAIFTGYCVEGTNGYKLLNFGYIEKDGERAMPSVPIKYLDFSAHAGRSELFEFVEKSKPKKVICIHGDRCPEFAEELKLEGFDATAPKAGDKIEI